MEEERVFNGFIIEKYEIKYLIGTGGMSCVYLAVDRRLQKEWAIKEIKKVTYGSDNRPIVNVLLAEVNLLKRLDHPALPRIVDIIDERDSIYIVMDYIEGESLDKVLEREKTIAQEVVVEWGIQLCDVLQYLHAQNPPIIYRDMKPGNIMRKPNGQIKLIDFGIAREYKEKSQTDTTALGTQGYAPPEQHGMRQTDVRSDIYALGMTLHHLLTGVDPRTRGYVYHPIRYWDCTLSAGLEFIIDTCTAFSPEMRYQNCEELQYALRNYERANRTHYFGKVRKAGSLCLFLAMCSLFLMFGREARDSRQRQILKSYEQKITISSATDYQTKVDTYLSAIELYGKDIRAYQKLLETYQENAVFGEEESRIFLEKYNENQLFFDKESEEYQNLLFQIGLLYFYFYSGKDASFRMRVLKSYPYFESIVETGKSDLPFMSMARHYYVIGSFYKQYVIENINVKEPTKEYYEQFIDSLTQCLGDVEQYEGEEAAYLQLTMYREIFYLLHEQRKGLAVTDVDEGTVLELLSDIGLKVETLTVTQEKSIEIQEDILSLYETYIQDVERSYTNTRKWRQAKPES